MIIKNGTLVLGNRLQKADLKTEGGIIAGIGKFQSGGESAQGKTIDAKGMLVFAGFIDPHVHLRDPEDTKKEDFSTGTAAALAGGYACIIDMPNYRNPPTTTAAALAQKKEIAGKKARCNYSFHFGATQTNFKEVKKANPSSLKAFLSNTHSELFVQSDDALERHFREFAHEKPILVHAEDASTIELEKERGIGASLAGIKRAGSIAAKIGRRVHFCHLSSSQEVAFARRFGGVASCEVTPHHLFLCEKDALKNPLASMNPPLRSNAQAEGLWKMLGDVDIIATDHAPHTLEDKKNGAAGVPGLETAVALMLDAASKKRISYVRIAQMMCSRPAELFGMHGMGKLQAGNAADITIVDPKETWKVRAGMFQSKCDWSPFEGKTLRGRVKITIVGGKVAYEKGEIIAKMGSGKEISRTY